MIFIISKFNFVRPGGSCQGSLPSQASFIDTRTRTRIRLNHSRVLIMLLTCFQPGRLPPYLQTHLLWSPHPLLPPAPSLHQLTPLWPALQLAPPTWPLLRETYLPRGQPFRHLLLLGLSIEISARAVQRKERRKSWTVHKEEVQRDPPTSDKPMLKETFGHRHPTSAFTCCYNHSLLSLFMNK